MATALQKSLSLKVSLALAVVTTSLTGLSAFFITTHQTRAMQEVTLNKGTLAAALGAQTYGSMLEDAIDNGYLTVDQVFDRNYREIAGYNWGGRPKYHTQYDFYTDRIVLRFQDRFLDSEDFVYAVGTDLNGYVPTHNTAYQAPLSGDPERDIAGNRTKRIFSDPVERQAATSTAPSLIQRLLPTEADGHSGWDVSAPIFVKGKHWGGFRVGVSAAAIARHQRGLIGTLALTFGALVLCTVGMIFLMIKRAMKPLERLTLTAAQISVGEGLDHPIRPTTVDEIGRMAKALDRLRASLSAAMTRLGE